jgi:hypothetical protein
MDAAFRFEHARGIPGRIAVVAASSIQARKIQHSGELIETGAVVHGDAA